MSPTKFGEAGTVGYGAPRNLTKRIAAPASSTSPALSPSAGGVGRRDDGSNHRVDIVVQLPEVRSTASEPPEEELAEPIADVGPSALELMYRGSLAKPGRDLRQFGYDFFAALPEEIADVPVGADYELLAGDELVLTFTGSLKGIHKVLVSDDGSIAVPDVGNVAVAGRRLADVESAVTTFAREEANRRGFRLDVAMGARAFFQVKVVGEVALPGLVDVPRGGTVLTALAVAGGPLRSGSLRRVEVRRDGEELLGVDLYTFLAAGVEDGLVLLEPGDTIVVPTIGASAAVAGYVVRPGIYELRGETSLGRLIELAGGMTPFSFRGRAQIEVTESGRRRAPVDIALDDAGLARLVKSGEMLTIDSIDGTRQQSVEVGGEVVSPGRFEYRAGMRLSELLERANGLTIDAYLSQAIVSRQIGAEGSITIVPGRTSIRTTRRVLLVDLERAIAGDKDHDIVLMPLDQLRIQSSRDAIPRPVVTVMGAVRVPGTYELTADMRVSELIAIAGNVQPEVYFDEAELLRREYDEEQRGLKMRRYRFDLGKAMRAGGEADPLLSNGDEIVIRALRFARVKVFIEGEVRFPGPYAFPAGARISDLIAAAGGVLPNADMRATTFMRRSVKENQLSRFRHLKERTQQLYEQALEKLVMGGHANEGLAAKLSLEQTREMLSRIETSQSTGRVVIPFVNEDFPQSVYDLTLENDDRLIVKPRQETISVLGQVFNPGTFVAQPGVTVSDLLRQSGGITADGDDDRLYVVRADGTVQGFDHGHYALYRSTQMLPGDVVLVPRRAPERTLYSNLTDVLMLARQSAEIAFILGRVLDEDSNLSMTSVFQGREFNGVDDTLLNRGR